MNKMDLPTLAPSPPEGGLTLTEYLLPTINKWPAACCYLQARDHFSELEDSD